MKNPNESNQKHSTKAHWQTQARIWKQDQDGGQSQISRRGNPTGALHLRTMGSEQETKPTCSEDRRSCD